MFHHSEESFWVTYPAEAEKLSQFDGIRSALIGNSVTENGVELERFIGAVEEKGIRPVKAVKFTKGGTPINTWHFWLVRYFWEPKNETDLVVIPFFGDQLSDGNRLKPFSETVNAVNHAHRKKQESPPAPRTRTYRALKRLLETAQRPADREEGLKEGRLADRRVVLTPNAFSSHISHRARCKTRALPAFFIRGMEAAKEIAHHKRFSHERSIHFIEPRGIRTG